MDTRPLMTSEPNIRRQPPGAPTGGQFAAHQRAESSASLSAANAALSAALLVESGVAASDRGLAASAHRRAVRSAMLSEADAARSAVLLAAAGVRVSDRCPECGDLVGAGATADGVCRRCAFPPDVLPLGDPNHSVDSCSVCAEFMDSERCVVCGAGMTVSVSSGSTSHCDGHGAADLAADADHHAVSPDGDDDDRAHQFWGE